uniref:Abhydrolase domain containing 16B n=1 Tax=Aotus nancymaae TaxID=37293 RepID=A0A2K5CC74_AOTNA
VCFIRFVKALVHMFKSYLTASYTDTFRGWPVDFRWDDVGAAGVWLLRDAARGAQSLLQQLRELPGHLASYALARSLGRWLAYPGSVSLMTRTAERLLERHHGRRAKLVACDGGIDGTFLDRRQQPGSLSAPLKAGHSMLGWTTPGFGGSTGVPFPQHDADAVDVVVKYSPSLGAPVLDATFDDLVLLALKVMPHSWKGLVVRTVREHFNLNVAEQPCCYPGPRYPAVMAGEGQAVVTRWLRAGSLAQAAAFYACYRVDKERCLALLRSYRARCEEKLEGEEAQGPHGPGFPRLVGQGLRSRRRWQLALFLAREHLNNVEATHCSPLEPEDFQLPWGL